MNRLIIRTFSKDDYLGRLCSESFKMAGMNFDTVYIGEDYNYQYLDAPFIKRGGFGNFGGTLGVYGISEIFNKIDVSNGDYVYLSDADIVILNKIMLPEGIEHAGTGGQTPNLLHISGQLQILKGNVYNHIKSLSKEEVDSIIWEMMRLNLSVCDDTFISFVTDKFNYKKHIFIDEWLHIKFYKYNGRMDFDNVLKEIASEQHSN